MADVSIGLDIGSRTVMMAEMAMKKGRPVVANIGGLDLPQNVAREGEVLDADAVSRAVKQLLGEIKPGSKKVHLGVSNPRVVVRYISMVWQPTDQIAESLPYIAAEHMPVPVDEVELDFVPLSEDEEGTDPRQLHGVLIAAHRDMLANLLDSATDAGLKPTTIDLNAFAVMRAAGGDQTYPDTVEALVDVGGGLTDVIINDNGRAVFIRSVPHGSHAITEAIEARTNHDLGAAEAIKRQPDQMDGEVQTVVREQLARFVDELASTLNYYQAQRDSKPIDRVVVSGGGAHLEGLAPAISRAVRIPAEVFNPFERFAAPSVGLSPDALARVGPSLTTAIGLALGGLR